jgi:hypothetical protein
MPLVDKDTLRLDYERTYDNYKWLADVRFKLLAAVPTVSVVASAFLTQNETDLRRWLALPGLLATIGIALYELRNSQHYDATIHRLKELEKRLEMVQCTDEADAGGLFNERPRQRQRLFGLLTFWHDRALGFAYGASVASWVFVLSDKRVWATVASFFAVVLEFSRLEKLRHSQ